MALEYKVFQPKKCADEETWKVDLGAKVELFADLEKAGADRKDDLQLFLAEVVWSVVRNDLSIPHAVELISKTPVAVKEPLQRLFADALWVVGFAATEAPPRRESRDEFYQFVALLEKERVIPARLLALGLETEALPPAVCQIQTLKKKANQAKTKARYTITRYNLLREHSEGYARLVCLLERLASCSFAPAASPEQLAESERVLADDVVRLAGFGHLCPNRIIAMTLDVYETRLVERDASPLVQPLLSLLKRFPPKRLTEVAVFTLLAHPPAPPAPGAREAPKPAQPPLAPPSRSSQLLAVASLVQAGLVELDTLWSYLDPADSALTQLHADMMSKYEEEVGSLGKVDLGGNSSGKDRNSFDRALQSFNQAGSQKLRLATALISMNCWSAAHRVLVHLQSMCKPCLNHHVRSALCDLLKWLIWPYLHKDAAPHPLGKQAGVESTFQCTRRFGLGSEDAEKSGTNGHASVPAALSPSTDSDKLLPQIRLVLEHLEYFLHTDIHLLTALWKFILAYIKEQHPAEGSQVVLDEQLVAIIYRHLLPAASLVPNNPFLSDLMWSVLRQLGVYQRFLIYSCWETTYDNFLLKLVCAKTKSQTKQILKRVVSNAEKRDLIAHQSHFHICKLCHSNPIPCLETMLSDLLIGFNVNMIQPYVECTNRCPEMTADIMGYMISRTCSKPSGADRVFLSKSDATYAPWLQNMGEFAGRFFKKHPQTDLHGLLTIITKRINSETDSAPKEKGSPSQEYKGESLIRLILESLIEHMGGLLTVADMTAEQLICLAGGPRLRSESVSHGGKKEDNARKDKARVALLSALVDQGLVPVLWYSLSRQRHHFLSEEFSESHGGGGGLKLLSLLFDGNHQCFLHLTEFLSQACPRDKYAALMPPTQQVFSMFEPNLAFLAMRNGLPSYGRAMAQAAAAVKDGEATDAPTTIQEPESVLELERVVRMFLPKTFEDEGLSMPFYITFWRLSLQDIFAPTEGYDKADVNIQNELKATEVAKKQMERDRDFNPHAREYRSLKKEVVRLQDFSVKLKEERSQQLESHKQVMARLEQEKAGWFTKPSPHATAAFVADMICPRVLTSHADALFCCHFVRMLVKLKTPGFQLLDFYNSWTIMLTQCIRCCSEREAQIFGVFLRDMMSYVLHLRDDEERYNVETKDNPCFHRNYYEDPKASMVEWTQFGDIKKGHSKWEGRIYKALRAGLDSDDWMERRNTLLLLSQSYEAFPLVEKYAKPILNAIESMRDKEEYSDLKTLAASIAVKLRTQRDRWVEKAPEKAPDKQAEKGADDSGRNKSSGTKASDGKTSDGKTKESSENGVAVPSESRDRDRDRDRDRVAAAAEKEESAAKRSRVREDGHKESKDPKDGREHKVSTVVIKDAKESKEGREHKSSSALVVKDAKEVKESSRDAAASDRKRGSERNASGHEDREKRRRSERVDAAPAAGSRGASERSAGERHGGSGYSQPRNALAAPAEQGSQYNSYRSSGGSNGGDYSRGGGRSAGAGGGSGGGYSSNTGGRYGDRRR
mmetsp:Transcript_113724/g.361381  ORF Transcript_113724/g.361381 Transcript_113724/m.361381 type:complete len:1522 (-) Transcript_113724:89-4654(-)